MDVLTLDSHAKDLLIYLNELYIGKSLCDVHIRSKDGIYFPAHKIVIASSSLYIYQMVMSSPETSQISLDVPSHVLHLLIEFIYTGKLVIQRHLWLDMQNAATYLQMYHVLDLMKRYEALEIQATPTLVPTSSTGQLIPASTIKTDENNKQVNSVPANKNTVDIGTMTIDIDLIDGAENPTLNNYKAIKTESQVSETVKTPESLQSDTDRGTLTRLRPLVRKDFSNMHEELPGYTFTSKKEKRKSVESPVDKQKKKSKKKKKRKYKKRVNKFGKEMRYKCLYCNQRFKLLYKRHRHLCRSHTDRYYTWLFSSYLLKKSCYLNPGTNMCKRKIRDKKLYCRLCRKRYSRYSQFASHFSRHHSSKFGMTWFNYVSHRSQRLPGRAKCKREYECLKCPKAFISESNLAIHYQRYHFDAFDMYQMDLLNRLKERRADNSCKLCGKNYHFRSSLSRHMVLHKDEKPHQCAICGKIFSLKSGLKEHAIVHEDNKMNICAVCGKCYKHRQSLRRHMTEHDPDKKVFTCVICGKVFNRNDKYLTHVKSHEAKHHNIMSHDTSQHTLAPPQPPFSFFNPLPNTDHY